MTQAERELLIAMAKILGLLFTTSPAADTVAGKAYERTLISAIAKVILQ